MYIGLWNTQYIFFKQWFYLFFFFLFFWPCWVLVVACEIFRCDTGSSLWCAGFSLVAACGFSLSSCGAPARERMGSVVCGMRALLLRRVSWVVVACGLSCPVACRILVPQPGIEPASPALEGGFFTTGPPGKSLSIHFCYFYLFLRSNQIPDFFVWF